VEGPEERRVLRLRLRPIATDGPPWQFGSGYFVASGRVLTAAHVLVPPDGDVPVSVGHACEALLWPSDDTTTWLPAHVVWVDPDADVALVAVDEGTAWEPVRFGHLVGADVRAWMAAGFPIAALHETRRFSETAFGRFSPLGKSEVDGLSLTVESRTPRALTEEETGWAGLSGAAIFCGRHLVGVVTTDPVAWEVSIEGVRLATVVQSASFAAALGGAAVVERAAVDASVAPAPDAPRVKGALISVSVESWRNRDQLRRDLREALLARQRIISVVGPARRRQECRRREGARRVRAT
jgi:hypothetical protein